jgi:hypothetical protein
MTKDLIKVGDKNTKLEIDGEKVSIKNFEFFLDIVEGMILEEAFEKHGISRATYYRLSQKDWWNKLIVTYIQPAQDRLTVGMSKLVPQMLETTEAILNGDFKTPKMAGAAAKIIENFQKVGFKRGNVMVTPMMHSMRDLYLQETNIIHKEENNYNVNLDTLKDILSPEEMLDFALGKGLPSKVIDEIKQKAEDVESVDITEVGDEIS